jgi:hypothetical protein
MNTLGTLKVLFPADRYDHMNFAFDSEPRYHFNRRAVLSCFSVLHSVPTTLFSHELPGRALSQSLVGNLEN